MIKLKLLQLWLFQNSRLDKLIAKPNLREPKNPGPRSKWLEYTFAGKLSHHQLCSPPCSATPNEITLATSTSGSKNIKLAALQCLHFLILLLCTLTSSSKRSPLLQLHIQSSTSITRTSTWSGLVNQSKSGKYQHEGYDGISSVISELTSVLKNELVC